MLFRPWLSRGFILKRGSVWSFALQLLLVFTWCLYVSHSPPFSSPLLSVSISVSVTLKIFFFSRLCFLFSCRCKVWRRWTAIRSRSLLRGRWQRHPARHPQSRRHPWTQTKPPYIGRTNLLVCLSEIQNSIHLFLNLCPSLSHLDLMPFRLARN